MYVATGDPVTLTDVSSTVNESECIKVEGQGSGIFTVLFNLSSCNRQDEFTLIDGKSFYIFKERRDTVRCLVKDGTGTAIATPCAPEEPEEIAVEE